MNSVLVHGISQDFESSKIVVNTFFFVKDRVVNIWGSAGHIQSAVHILLFIPLLAFCISGIR